MVAVKHKKLHEIFEVSRSSLYYKSKKYKEDLEVKEKIEKVWLVALQKTQEAV